MTNISSRRLPIAIASSTLLASTLVFGLVGCSASGTSSGTASGTASAGSSASTNGAVKSSEKVDPCVLTAAEVSTAISETITSAKSDEAECAYNGGGHYFSVNVFPNSTDSDWKAQLKILDLTQKATTVGGIGDRADGSGGTLDVQSGSYILNVIGVDEDGTTTWPKSVALAKAIIAKLP